MSAMVREQRQRWILFGILSIGVMGMLIRGVVLERGGGVLDRVGLDGVEPGPPGWVGVADLLPHEQRELQLFGVRAMGIAATLQDMKNLQSPAEIEELVATGLNMKGKLCAEIIGVQPDKEDGWFFVRCREYRQGSGEVMYLLSSNGDVVQ